MNQNLNVVLKLFLKTIKFLEENIGENLHDLELGNIFLNLTQKYKQTKKMSIN